MERGDNYGSSPRTIMVPNPSHLPTEYNTRLHAYRSGPNRNNYVDPHLQVERRSGVNAPFPFHFITIDRDETRRNNSE